MNYFLHLLVISFVRNYFHEIFDELVRVCNFNFHIMVNQIFHFHFTEYAKKGKGFGSGYLLIPSSHIKTKKNKFWQTALFQFQWRDSNSFTHFPDLLSLSSQSHLNHYGWGIRRSSHWRGTPFRIPNKSLPFNMCRSLQKSSRNFEVGILLIFYQVFRWTENEKCLNPPFIVSSTFSGKEEPP